MRLSLILLIGFMSSCHQSFNPQALSVSETQDYKTPQAVLFDLMQAQDNFYAMSGRFSMDLNPLIERKFLNEKAKEILSNKDEKFSQWQFVEKSLPFPDEDVSWCYVAQGPQGHVILAVYTGLWERFDGLCPLEPNTLPPRAPWQRVEPQ